jgi:hypothetical protein
MILPMWMCARPAACGYVPESAYSRSLGLDPALLDYPSQMFRLPEMAPLYAPQAFAFSESRDELGLGASIKVGSQRLLVLSQPRPVRSGAATYSPGYAIGGTTMLQAGWGGSLSGVRLGLAARGFIEQGWDDDSYQYFGYYYDDRRGYSEGRTRVLEGAFGIGIGTRRGRLDAAVESRWVNMDDGMAELSNSNGNETAVLAAFHRSGKPFYSYVLQAQLPVGPRSDLLATGSWGGHHESWGGYLLADVQGTQIDSVAQLESYEDAWMAGAALRTATAFLDRMTVAASYRSSKTPDFSAGQGDLSSRYSTARQGRISLSLEKQLRGPLHAQAGLDKFYTFTRLSAVLLSPNNHVDFSTTQDEATTDRFSWGLTYSWRKIRLAGSLQTTLDLMSPFAALDVRYEF